MSFKNYRINKNDWYFKIAKDMALRSSCLSRRRFGAILVKDDAIISTGYAGTVRGAKNCGVDMPCLKDLYKEEPNKSYEHCGSIHAEMNCIINAARNGISTLGATLYLSEVNNNNGRPCYLCRRFLINAGVKDCYYYIPIPENKRITDKDMTYIGETFFYIVHEEVNDWVKLENEWLNEQLENGLHSQNL